jgi:hypothetical protein
MIVALHVNGDSGCPYYKEEVSEGDSKLNYPNYRKEIAVVDYELLHPNNWKLPDPEPEPEEEPAAPQPEVAIVWNVYKEKGDAKSMALKISLRLPLA